MDLSWPLGSSVNSCVPSNVYDDVPFILKYPTIDQVVERIKLVGAVIDVVKSLHGCDRELIFNVISQLRSIPITSIWNQETSRKLTLYVTFIWKHL